MLELIQNLTPVQMVAVCLGLYLVYRYFFAGKTPVVNTSPLVSAIGASAVTSKINSVLNPTIAPTQVTIEPKKVVSLVSEWADLRAASVENGATDAVKKLDDMFPLLNISSKEQK